MDSKEFTAKTIEEAVAAALTELQVTEDQIEYEILDVPSKGLFGIIGNKPARIQVSVKIAKKIDPLTVAHDFLSQVFDAMHIDVKIEILDNDECKMIHLHGDNLGVLIGKHGQTLDALQYLTNLAANHDAEERVRIVIDIEDYRKRREETLSRLAFRLADKVKRHHERVVLEPMSAHERKIIHMALQDDARISTYSEGEEPYRKVVIALKR
ncbi:MAG: single-stranded nucleic acid binding protein [Firmicutes bacterium]|nr:single-stranded nucleic acid binding protein [Bacillota bacterium]